MTSAIAIIPARLGSTRLPRKVLADIHGKPLIRHVWERVCQATRLDAVYLATDAEEVRAAAEGWGAKVLMTSPDCRSGTERLADCLDHVQADLVINVQGDEPLVDPAMLDALVAVWQEGQPDLITPIFRITAAEDLTNQNVVKVARTAAGQALYFSRNAIPFVRDAPPELWLARQAFWGHIGVYGYRREVLAAYPKLPISALEQAEQLEQLRFLEAGFQFQTVETSYRPIAVDVADDLERVRSILSGAA